MSRTIRRLALLGLAAALGLLVAGLASAAPKAGGAAHAFKTPHFVLDATLVIRSDTEHGAKGADGKWHDAYLPGNFDVLGGVPVRVTVYNYDDAPHSFTSPGLHVNQIIKKGSEATPSKTTFTFTPTTAGKFAWWCAMPCDPYAMAHVGLMRGYVNVT